MTRHPRVRLQKGMHKRVAGGHPWAYSNEIVMDAAAKALAPGSVVTLETAGGEALATAHFNPRTLIAARALDRQADVPIDRAWFAQRLSRALGLRARLFDRPFYRLAHAEGDGLPGLVIDRFSDVLVVQPNTAGMNAAVDDIVGALVQALDPRAVVVRGDSAARTLEGLDETTAVVHGAVDAPVTVDEGCCTFFADVQGGQKTGWFFDQRDNRAFVAGLVRRWGAGVRLLDLYTHTGGFAVQEAIAGATQAVGVDGSAHALDLAGRAAAASGVAGHCAFEKADVFDWLASGHRDRAFEVVVADPPAFVKSRKDLAAGLRGYRKLARLAAARVAPGGVLAVASCSHNAGWPEFTAAVAAGLHDAGRSGRILRSAGAGPDHPVHPQLPESAYLKAMFIEID
ncbi:MAG: class I SAM-dependent rRNA methyltransferase [Rhodospirillaceae bacterium]|nr:class I SAM-dependent rRNA methyltransferase [Rhodospirillaceae bacterium]